MWGVGRDAQVSSPQNHPELVEDLLDLSEVDDLGREQVVVRA